MSDITGTPEELTAKEQMMAEKVEAYVKNKRQKSSHVTGPLEQIAEWAPKRKWEDLDGKRLKGYFVRAGKNGEPAFSLAEGDTVYVSRGTRTGVFEGQSGNAADVSGTGWIIFGKPGSLLIWRPGEDEPPLLAEYRSQKAVEREYHSDDKVRGTLSQMLENAPTEAEKVPSAADVWAIIQSGQGFAHPDEPERLFRVSIALHLHGGEIYDLGEVCGFDALMLAFAEALPGNGRTMWLEGQGKDALKSSDKSSFLQWSRQFWTAMAGLGPISEDMVSDLFDHDKGFNRGTTFVRKSKDSTSDPHKFVKENLFTTLGRDPLVSLIGTFTELGRVNKDTTYDEFEQHYQEFEQDIKFSYENGIDITPLKAVTRIGDYEGK